MKIKRNHATVLIELAIIGMILFPVLYISMHAIPVADDFTNAVTIKRRMGGANGGLYIIEVLKQLHTYYMSWGGYYFSFFITSFFQPFMLGGLTGLRLMILLINMVFYGTLGILVSVLLVILLVVSIKYIKDETGFQYPLPLGMMLVLLSGIVVVNFPVCLGYAGENYFPERCIWIEDCTIYIVSIFMVFYISGWLKRKKYVQELSHHAILCIAVSCVLFTCGLGARKGLNTYPLAQMANEIARGNIREYSQYWEQVLYEIAHSQDDEVTIVRSWKPSSEFLYEVGISDDKDLWVNAAIAEFYGKESVSFIIQTD